MKRNIDEVLAIVKKMRDCANRLALREVKGSTKRRELLVESLAYDTIISLFEDDYYYDVMKQIYPYENDVVYADTDSIVIVKKV